MWPELVFLLFWFCLHARCGCCSIVCLRFQVVQIKQADWKMSTKDVNNCKTFINIFWATTHTRVQNHKKADSDASAKWKEVKGKPAKINELILKTNVDLKEGTGNIIVILRLCFLLIDWLITWRRWWVHLKQDIQGRGGGSILDVDGRVWTIFMDVICVSSLTCSVISLFKVLELLVNQCKRDK